MGAQQKNRHTEFKKKLADSRLWTAYEAAAATGGALCARGGDGWVAEEWAASGVSIDTRTLQPGEIFVALADVRDGHDFIGSAFERGAAAALVDKAPTNAPDGKPLLLVNDTLNGLRDLARAARRRNFGKRLAVTGSAGKTTTKEMLRAALGAAGGVHAADRSFNNHFGVPLTLAQMPMSVDYGVFEIGMNHAGEITPLTKLVAPDIAIVTTVAPAHLEFFGTTEKIAEAKAEIFLGVPFDGAAILPIDNEHYDLLRARAVEAGIENLFTFGEHADANVRLVSYETDGVVSTIEAEVFGDRVAFSLTAPGVHMAKNALAVLAATEAAGVPAATAIDGLQAFTAGAGRGEKIDAVLPGDRRVTVLDESYNANPVSMQAAISLLGAMSPPPGGRRIAILGDMLELGSDAEALHAGLAEPLVAAAIDKVYAAGDIIKALWGALPAETQGGFAPTAHELKAALLDELVDGDIVMVKGSNASKVGEIVSFLRAGGSSGS